MICAVMTSESQVRETAMKQILTAGFIFLGRAFGVEVGCCLFCLKQGKGIIEYPELKGTLKEHQIQLLALHKTAPGITLCT